MIEFSNLSNLAPYKIFKQEYEKATLANQSNIEAACISSYSNEIKEVNARFVNLKIIDQNEFIFFSNYESTKSREFLNHAQISASIFWSSTNFQIRMKANIKKTSTEFNNLYFAKRDKKKNALAISSKQSSKIKSYESIEENYKESLANSNLEKCPDYWGGYSFTPYYFEFWEGDDNRLNKREVYEKNDNNWNQHFLQP